MKASSIEQQVIAVWSLKHVHKGSAKDPRISNFQRLPDLSQAPGSLIKLSRFTWHRGEFESPHYTKCAVQSMLGLEEG